MNAMTSSEYVRKEVIEEAFSRGSFEYNLVYNSKLSPEMIDMLARKITDQYNLSTLARRENCLPETLEYMAGKVKSSDWYRANSIIQNKNCPASVLMKFSDEQQCHMSIVQNPNVTLEILDKILQNPNRLYLKEIQDRREELVVIAEREPVIIPMGGSNLYDIISESQKESIASVEKVKGEYFEEEIER